MNWKNANSTEIDPDTSYPVVINMPEHNQGQMGGTMRLGKRTTIFHGESILSIANIDSFFEAAFSAWHYISEKLYGNAGAVDERHRHRYEVNPQFVDQIEAAGLHFVGTNLNSEEIF